MKFLKIVIMVVAVFLLATVAMLGGQTPTELTADARAGFTDPGSSIIPATLPAAAEAVTLAPDDPVPMASLILASLAGVLAYRSVWAVVRSRQKRQHKTTQRNPILARLLQIRQRWAVGWQAYTA